MHNRKEDLSIVKLPDYHRWIPKSEIKRIIETNEDWTNVKKFLVDPLPKVQIQDIIGYDSIKKRVISISKEIKLIYNKNSPNFGKANYDPGVSAILLHGVSGVGKTSFTNLLANLLQDVCPFFSLTSGQLTSSYQGESEQNIQSLFKMASKVKILKFNKFCLLSKAKVIREYIKFW